MLFSRFRISGHSMIPIFSENDSVIASSIPYLFLKPKKKDIVVFEIKSIFYVKRITDIKGDNYFLSGDNENDSLDSRKLGYINIKQIKGKVIFKL